MKIERGNPLESKKMVVDTDTRDQKEDEDWMRKRRNQDELKPKRKDMNFITVGARGNYDCRSPLVNLSLMHVPLIMAEDWQQTKS